MISSSVIYLSWKSLSHVRLGDPWTIQSREFSRPEYWGGSPSLLQGIFPTQGLNSGLRHAGGFFTSWATREAPHLLWFDRIPLGIYPFLFLMKIPYLYASSTECGVQEKKKTESTALLPLLPEILSHRIHILEPPKRTLYFF